MRVIKPVLKSALILLLVLVSVVLAYLLYVVLTYHRLDDNLPLAIEGEAESDNVRVGEEYTIVTQNLGFGAYVQDFTFFMDGGVESRARSEEGVIKTIGEALDKVESLDPDFILFQEVDIDSTRSYHVDQYKLISDRFNAYSRCKAINYDSAYLMYPILEPHGASYSSMATFSRYTIDSSIRRSFPISTSLSKFLDLDRCYSVSRVTVDGGKELVIYNVHSSAYGGSDEIRTAQMTMLMNDMKAEYEKGNYVICGGDFNHDFTGDSTQKLNGGLGTLDFGWAQPFPAELIPEGFSRATNYKNRETNPTCRDCDIPYEEGNFTIIVDGFIISDNVTVVEVENIVTGFTYSDHNPVVLKFILE
ncbi:MAG: endonuclease/exonuclease/phosphatase family protein [Clostridia bacterium]|nr:endonuclease/exonuclease/phosphatase family protein [Clostridia bacterium]